MSAPLVAIVASLALADPALSRDDLVQEVLEANAAVLSAGFAVDAARARVRIQGAWPDPRVGVSVAPLAFGGDMRPGVVVEASQMLPLSGRLGLDRAAARIEVAVAEHDVAAVRLELALAASRLYDDYWLIGQALALNAEHRALVAELQDSARARYVVGKAPEAAPLTAELEGLQLEREAIALTSELGATVAAINGLLHRPAGDELPPPVVPPFPTEVPAAMPEPDGRPDLAALAEAQQLADVKERSARRGWTPDPMIMAEYNSMWHDEAHRWMVGVALDVPIQLGARQGAVDLARAERSRTDTQLAHAVENAQVEVRQAWLQTEAAREAYQLYEARLLPVASERLRASRIAFESDRADFLDLIEAERALLEVELGALSSAADYHRALSSLLVASGELPIRGDR